MRIAKKYIVKSKKGYYFVGKISLFSWNALNGLCFILLLLPRHNQKWSWFKLSFHQIGCMRKKVRYLINLQQICIATLFIVICTVLYYVYLSQLFELFVEFAVFIFLTPGL